MRVRYTEHARVDYADSLSSFPRRGQLARFAKRLPPQSSPAFRCQLGRYAVGGGGACQVMMAQALGAMVAPQQLSRPTPRV